VLQVLNPLPHRKLALSAPAHVKLDGHFLDPRRLTFHHQLQADLVTQRVNPLRPLKHFSPPAHHRSGKSPLADPGNEPHGKPRRQLRTHGVRPIAAVIVHDDHLGRAIPFDR
jgi:hypothetical protein